MAKVCIKISASVRAVEHVRCYDKKTSNNEDDGLTHNGEKLMHKNTKDVLKLLDKEKYNYRISQSSTDWGKSEYVLVGKKDDLYSFNDDLLVKIRISDHSVMNTGRVLNELHIDSHKNISSNDLDKIKKTVDYKFDRDNKFIIKDYEKKDIIKSLETKHLTQGDKIKSERITKKGEKIYIVERTKITTEKGYFYKEDGTFWR